MCFEVCIPWKGGNHVLKKKVLESSCPGNKILVTMSRQIEPTFSITLPTFQDLVNIFQDMVKNFLNLVKIFQIECFLSEVLMQI